MTAGMGASMDVSIFRVIKGNINLAPRSVLSTNYCFLVKSYFISIYIVITIWFARGLIVFCLRKGNLVSINIKPPTLEIADIVFNPTNRKLLNTIITTIW